MKFTLSLLVVLAVGAVSSVPVLEEGPKPYERYVKYTDEDGLIQTIDLEEEVDTNLLDSLARNPDNNRYWLFTRRNPEDPQELFMGHPRSVFDSFFNPRAETVVIVHGWLSNQESGINEAIKDAYLAKYDTNVIVLDWRRLARSNYVTAVRGVPAVGRGLGQFLSFISIITGARLDSIHLIGFSLGAHLVGNAGRELNGKVARITALDPAGPLWNLNSNKVQATDAIYVEGIHTDGGLELSLGIGYAVGDADFFPNGGNSQPGCLTSICHHNRAWRFFAASVTYDHLEGTGCSSYLQITLNTCRGAKLNMGNANIRKTGSGKYRVRTGRRYPY